MESKKSPNLSIYNVAAFNPAKEMEYETFVFPGGEVHFKLADKPSAERVLIECRINGSDDLMRLILCVDALKRMRVNHISAFIPYIPYARQDRVMAVGEPLSIRVFADIINGLGLDSISCYDIHNEASLALFNNINNYNNHEFVSSILGGKKDYLIVSPDAGSYKKIFGLCQSIGYGDDIIMCNKVRDLSNGKIKSITIQATDLHGKDVYIVDDICSRGGTFILIADKLKELNCGNIHLIVSHYEGVANEGEFKKARFGHIYKTNSISDYSSEFVSNYKL